MGTDTSKSNASTQPNNLNNEVHLNTKISCKCPYDEFRSRTAKRYPPQVDNEASSASAPIEVNVRQPRDLVVGEHAPAVRGYVCEGFREA